MLEGTDLILIHQLLGRYGHAIDGRDWEAFAALFVPEASIDYRGATSTVECQGIAEIVEYFRDANHPPAHPPRWQFSVVIDDDVPECRRTF